MIKDFFLAAITFMGVYAKKMQYDLSEKSENRQQRLISEIEKYRSNPSSDNTFRADYLQEELRKEKERYNTIFQ